MSYEEEIEGWMKACQVVDQRRSAFIKGYREALYGGGLARRRDSSDGESVKAFPYPPKPVEPKTVKVWGITYRYANGLVEPVNYGYDAVKYRPSDIRKVIEDWTALASLIPPEAP